MELSHQTNSQPHLGSPGIDCFHDTTPTCTVSPLETSPLSSTSELASENPLSTEHSRDFSVSREPLESDDELTAFQHPTSTSTSPQTHIPDSWQNTNEPPTPVQQFVNALDTPPGLSLSSASTRSSSSNSGLRSSGSATCIVCMDQSKDILLAPCQHSHCCLSCFRRTQIHACPMCRTQVRSVVLLSTGMELPISLVMPRTANNRRDYVRASVTFGELESREVVPYERPRSLISRRSAPQMRSFQSEEVSSIYSRTTSTSSVGVARQAEYSVRPVPPSQEAALRRLRQTGTVQTMREQSSARSESVHVRQATRTHEPVISEDCPATSPTTQREASPRNSENIVLVGHDRKLMTSLVQKLITAFLSPSTNGRHSPTRDKSTFVVGGKVIRLVIVQSNPAETRIQLAMRVQRQSPKLVLMCADYRNVSSFESIVRLDMEVLDYLNLPCSWVLIKSMQTKRPRWSHSVENSDVRAAKHFISSRRRCFLLTVDAVQENATMRKLGYYLYRVAYKASTSADSGSLREEEHMNSPRKKWSFFCMRIDRPPRQRSLRNRIRRSSIGLGRWLS